MATKAAPTKAAPKKAAKKVATKKSLTGTRGRAQDRSKVAGGQDYEVNYESKKTGKSASDVKKAVKSAGNSRKKVEGKLK